MIIQYNVYQRYNFYLFISTFVINIYMYLSHVYIVSFLTQLKLIVK